MAGDILGCDVLVVGAGPAGSSAGKASAERGARTLVIDRKKEIGTPVQCGEVVGLSLLKMSDLKIPRSLVCARQGFTRFVISRSWTIDNASPYWESMTVERKVFDKYLAMEAARAGASVQADCRLISAELDGDDLISALVRHRGKDVSIRPKVVIAADGVHSTVAKVQGVEGFEGDGLAKGIEFEMVSKRKLPPCMQIFIEPEIGLGYGWIIPKGPYRANVGLGLVGRSASRRDFLSDWINDHPIVSQYFDPDKVLEVKAGDAPVPGFKGGPFKGNVLYAGDAAGQTLAFVGEGIIPSYICGSVAGRCAAKKILDANYDLADYDIEVRRAVQAEMELGTDLRDALVVIWSLPELTEVQRSLISGLIMNELVNEDDMVLLSSVPDEEEMLTLARERIGSSGRPIKIKRAI
ncbi:MAG: NAD(P)/FAD-dependent oxidoreductase [Methanomassiliicoccales archaeon]|nr:MAG: NAD(P)/FAD-dependent oxidoreductase [Methanomassiliicoccales archaeon]